MNSTWTVPVFTPAKFALLALTAIAIAIGTNGGTPHQSTGHAAMRPIDLVGTDYGTLTDTVFMIPAPPTHGSAPRPSPAPIIRRTYPPLAR